MAAVTFVSAFLAFTVPSMLKITRQILQSLVTETLQTLGALTATNALAPSELHSYYLHRVS